MFDRVDFMIAKADCGSAIEIDNIFQERRDFGTALDIGTCERNALIYTRGAKPDRRFASGV